MTSDLARLAALAASELDGFRHADAKAEWHKLGKRVLKALAKQVGGGIVRGNVGGPAVAGETLLVNSSLYVCILTTGILYRAASTKDPYGSRSENRWIQWSEVERDGLTAIVRFAGEQQDATLRAIKKALGVTEKPS